MMVENVKVYDLEESIKASKYPMSVNNDALNTDITKTVVSLAQSPKGEGHDQFLTGIRVSFDLTCSNKMWVEAERYRFLEFVSSQSTMHRICKFDIKSQCNEYVDPMIVGIVEDKVKKYNNWSKYQPTDEWFKDNNWNIENKEQYADFVKRLYLEVLYNIPSGFELTARLTTNYRCLKGIYAQRKTHRLPEWRKFCKWIETLPHSELITGESNVTADN